MCIYKKKLCIKLVIYWHYIKMHGHQNIKRYRKLITTYMQNDMIEELVFVFKKTYVDIIKLTFQRCSVLFSCNGDHNLNTVYCQRQHDGQNKKAKCSFLHSKFLTYIWNQNCTYFTACPYIIWHEVCKRTDVCDPSHVFSFLLLWGINMDTKINPM
jgi:hypothetical protein